MFSRIPDIKDKTIVQSDTSYINVIPRIRNNVAEMELQRYRAEYEPGRRKNELVSLKYKNKYGYQTGAGGFGPDCLQNKRIDLKENI